MLPLTLHSDISAAAEVVVTVVGEIDAGTAPAVAEHLHASPLDVDVMDLRFVTFIDASGITQLLEASSDTLAVVVSRQVQRVLEICELTDHFEIRMPTGSAPAFHRADFGVAVHADDLRFTYVNDALATINGLPASAHYGCQPDELFDVEHDDLTTVLQRVLATGRAERFPVVSEIDGEPGSFDCRYHPGEFNGRPVVVAIVEPAPTDAHDERLMLSAHHRLSSV